VVLDPMSMHAYRGTAVDRQLVMMGDA
jgi:hypothetical protein